MPVKTNNGKQGGTLSGKPHYDKSGKPIGGIKAVVTDAGGKPVELEGGEVIINAQASKKHWKELSRINQSAGNGVPILPPNGAADEDPQEYKDGGTVIHFNPNHIPNAQIISFAQKLKTKHPDVWKMAGNTYGNQAFENLERVSKRGHWLDSEEWMYVKWRTYVNKHKKDKKITDLINMLKWGDKVDSGWAFMRDAIEKRAGEVLTTSPRRERIGENNKMKKGANIFFTPDSCVSKIIDRFNEISEVKEHFIEHKKLIIVFKEKLYPQDIEQMNKQLSKMEYCHKFAEDSVELSDGVEYNTVVIRLKVEGFTPKKFNVGGNTESKIPVISWDKEISDISNISELSEKTQNLLKSATRIGSKGFDHLIGYNQEDKIIWWADGDWMEEKDGFTVTNVVDWNSSEPFKFQAGGNSVAKNCYDCLHKEIETKMAKGGNMPSYEIETPTGKKSKLSYLQQILVRTSGFKAFFGDWLMAAKIYLKTGKDTGKFAMIYKDVSKVIDYETLEPRLVFHGTRSEKEFFGFDVSREKGVGRPYAYFSHNIEYAKNFTTSSQRQHSRSQPFLYECFLNVRNPFHADGRSYMRKLRDAEGWLFEISGSLVWDKHETFERNEHTKKMEKVVNSQIGEYVKDVIGDEKEPFWKLMARDLKSDFKYFLMSHGYDGIFYGEELKEGYDVENPAEFTEAVTIFNPNDIKLGDGRNLEFNSKYDDIRMEDGGKISEPQQVPLEETKTRLGRVLFGDQYGKGGKISEPQETRNPIVEEIIEISDNRKFVEDLIEKMKL